ncbi:MAG: J domain-containing protein [Cyanobacteria bacterium J06560_2]
MKNQKASKDSTANTHHEFEPFLPPDSSKFEQVIIEVPANSRPLLNETLYKKSGPASRIAKILEGFAKGNLPWWVYAVGWGLHFNGSVILLVLTGIAVETLPQLLMGLLFSTTLFIVLWKGTTAKISRAFSEAHRRAAQSATGTTTYQEPINTFVVLVIISFLCTVAIGSGLMTFENRESGDTIPTQSNPDQLLVTAGPPSETDSALTEWETPSSCTTFPAHNPSTASQAARKEDLCVALSVSLQDVFSGALKTLQIDQRRADSAGTITETNTDIDISIPIGVVSGTVLTIPNKGDLSADGGLGNLYVHLHVLETDGTFTRKGNNLYLPLTIPPERAEQGGNVFVETIDNNTEIITIPSRTKRGDTFTIAGKGMPLPESPDIRGDQIVMLNF